MKRLLMPTLLALALLIAPGPSSALNCKDCVFDFCTSVGGDFGYRYCTERTIYRCLVSILVNGDRVCLYWTEIPRCDASGGCTGAY